MVDDSYHHATSTKELRYRSLVLQCGTSRSSRKFFSSWRTLFVCWPDYCDPHWAILIWTAFSLAAFFVDVGLDVNEAVNFFRSDDVIWGSSVVTFIILPHLVSVVYFMIVRGRIWYEAYPVGMIYWYVNCERSLSAV